jgi:hypothetical protein
VLILKDKLPLPIRRNVTLEFDSAQPFLYISESDRDLVKVAIVLLIANFLFFS